MAYGEAACYNPDSAVGTTVEIGIHRGALVFLTSSRWLQNTGHLDELGWAASPPNPTLIFEWVTGRKL